MSPHSRASIWEGSGREKETFSQGAPEWKQSHSVHNFHWGCTRSNGKRRAAARRKRVVPFISARLSGQERRRRRCFVLSLRDQIIHTRKSKLRQSAEREGTTERKNAAATAFCHSQIAEFPSPLPVFVPISLSFSEKRPTDRPTADLPGNGNGGGGRTL